MKGYSHCRNKLDIVCGMTKCEFMSLIASPVVYLNVVCASKTNVAFECPLQNNERHIHMFFADR